MERKVNEEAEVSNSPEQKAETLLKELGRVAIQLGRESVRASQEKKLNLIIASNLLNHAQNLAGIDDAKGRRILEQARRLLKKD